MFTKKADMRQSWPSSAGSPLSTGSLENACTPSSEKARHP